MYLKVLKGCLPTFLWFSISLQTYFSILTIPSNLNLAYLSNLSESLLFQYDGHNKHVITFFIGH